MNINEVGATVVKLHTSTKKEPVETPAIQEDTGDFKAAMTLAQVENGERNYQSSQEDAGVTRRSLFTFLTKGKKELIEIVKDEEQAEAVMCLIEAANINIEYFENMISMMKTSRNRLLFVMEEVHGEQSCNTDINQWKPESAK